MIQKIIQIGNSAGLTLSKNYLATLGLSVGDKIETSLSPNGPQLLVDVPKQKKKNVKSNKLTQEFQQWLNNFLEEDATLLDELADR